jgi:hypothetical protein
VVVGKGEAVVALEPAVVGMAAVGGFAQVIMDASWCDGTVGKAPDAGLHRLTGAFK